MHQHDQVCITNSSPIRIHLTQPNNIIEPRLHMTTHSENDIFKSCQILNIHVTISSPSDPIKLTSII